MRGWCSLHGERLSGCSCAAASKLSSQTSVNLALAVLVLCSFSECPCLQLGCIADDALPLTIMMSPEQRGCRVELEIIQKRIGEGAKRMTLQWAIARWEDHCEPGFAWKR